MMLFTAIGAIAALIALVGVPYTVIGYFRANPKRQLLYSVASRPLITNVAVPNVSVAVDGVAIEDPHFVEFRLKSVSRSDIPSNLFDSGGHIEVELEPHGTVVSVEEHGIEVSTWELNLDERRIVAHLEPQLIKRGSWLAIDFVTRGDAVARVRDHLIDVKVKPAADRRALQDLAESLLETGALPFTNQALAILRAFRR